MKVVTQIQAYYMLDFFYVTIKNSLWERAGDIYVWGSMRGINASRLVLFPKA